MFLLSLTSKSHLLQNQFVTIEFWPEIYCLANNQGNKISFHCVLSLCWEQICVQFCLSLCWLTYIYRFLSQGFVSYEVTNWREIVTRANIARKSLRMSNRRSPKNIRHLLKNLVQGWYWTEFNQENSKQCNGP